MNENMNGQYPNPQMQEPMQPQQGGNGMAIASLVLGIVSIVTCCWWQVSVVVAIVGLVLGILHNKKQTTGRGMAIAGIVLSIVGLAISIIIIVLGLIGIGVLEDITKELENMG
ncbi:MAG: DUF4190 domain-containing protein [Clostridiales bacterium]|nr:DUF4190 domain-containing protein [Clostridiales bacterium]